MQRKRCPKYIVINNNWNNAMQYSRCCYRRSLISVVKHLLMSWNRNLLMSSLLPHKGIYCHFRQENILDSVDLVIIPVYTTSLQPWIMYSCSFVYGFYELVIYAPLSMNRIVWWQTFSMGKILIALILRFRYILLSGLLI